MSHLLPPLTLRPGEKDPLLSYQEPATLGSGVRRSNLSIIKVALVTVPDKPEMTHVLQKIEFGKEQEIWPQGEQEGLMLKLLDHGYPKLKFPWSLYSFWRKGETATDEQDEEMQDRKKCWLEVLPDGATKFHEFNALNAIVRYFEDKSEANHLEIRSPATSVVAGRMPFDEYQEILDPPDDNDPSRGDEYGSLWLPKLAMDQGAYIWHEKREKQKAEEEKRWVEEQARADAERNANDVLRSICDNFDFRDQEGYGKAA